MSFYSKLNCTSSVICFSETWATSDLICNESSFQIGKQHCITSSKRIWQTGRLRMFVDKEISFKPSADPSKTQMM